MKRVYGIGVGPGDKELITLKAVNIIKACDVIFVPESKGESTAESIASDYIGSKRVVRLEFPMGEDNMQRYIQASRIIDQSLGEDESGAFLTLGDPMTYSTSIYLMEQLDVLGMQTSIVPGITSYSAGSAAAGWPLVMRDESFYLCDGDIDDEVIKRVDTIAVLKVIRNKEQILDKLENNNFKYVYIKRCTQREQRLIYDRQEILQDKDYMALILARRG